MSRKSVTSNEPCHASYAGRLPLFDQIAQGFLNALVNHLASGEALARLDYLDGKVRIDDAFYTRRLVVFAIEDLKQQIEAPLLLCSAAYALMKVLKLDPTPELKQYRDLATAILRIDAALHLIQISGARASIAQGPIYHRAA